jgi:predicted nucleic acid-binding Zn ribbon protein
MAVGEVLRGYLARAGLGPRLAQAQVVSDWPALVGPQIAAVTAPEQVGQDGTLLVRVATSAWMNELQLMTPQILARVNVGRRDDDGGRVRAIRWVLTMDAR